MPYNQRAFIILCWVLLFSPLTEATGVADKECAHFFERSSQQEEEPYSERLLRHAKTALENKDYYFAKRSSEEILRLDPDEPRAHWILAEIHRVEGNKTAALKAYQQVVALQGPTKNNLRALAIQYLKLGQNKEAFEVFAFAVKNRIIDAASGKGVVNALIGLDLFSEALVYIEMLLDARIKDSVFLGLKGRALYSLKDYDGALEAFDLQLKLEPAEKLALALKAKILNKMARYKEAFEVAEHFLRLVPASVEAVGLKVQALIDLGRADEALKLINQLLAADPKNMIHLTLKINALSALGRYEDALQVSKLQLRVSPHNKVATILKTETMLDLGMTSDVIQLMALRIRRFPDNTLAYVLQAEAFLSSGADERAQFILEKAKEQGEVHNVRYYGTQLLTHLVLGEEDQMQRLLERGRRPERGVTSADLALRGLFYARLGQPSQSSEAIKSWLRLNPESHLALALAMKAYASLITQDYARALEMSRKLLTLSPRHRVGQILKIQALLALGMPNEAYKELPIDATLEGVDAEVNSLLRGQTLLALGEFAKAKDEVRPLSHLGANWIEARAEEQRAPTELPLAIEIEIFIGLIRQINRIHR